MIGFDALLREIGALDAGELTLWIDSGWVRPEGEPGAWLFHEVDVARVRLIVEIHHELLDQLYGLRRELGALCGAIAAQPEATRQAICAALRERGGATR